MRTKLVFLGLFALVLAGCGQEQIAMSGLRAWIDAPRNRSTLPIAPFQVIAHASDAAGLQLVTLVVNGTTSGSMNCENTSQSLVTCRAQWTPVMPGNYRLEARATSHSGAVALSSPVFITVREKLNSPTPAGPARGSTDIATSTNMPASPSENPTSTPNLGTPTLAPRDTTITPSGTATRTPAPPPTLTLGAVCPGAPVISSFAASAGKISPSETTTLSWGFVSNATSVEIDHGVGGVGTPGSRVVSPATTTTFTLTARGCGGTATRQVTVQVTTPPTPTPSRTPTLDEPTSPSNLRQVSRTCSSPDQIRISWKDNSNNESGFRIYRRIRSSSTWTNWSLRASVGANSTQYTDGSGFGKLDDVEYGVEAYNAAGSSARPTLLVAECID